MTHRDIALETEDGYPFVWSIGPRSCSINVGDANVEPSRIPGIVEACINHIQDDTEFMLSTTKLSRTAFNNFVSATTGGAEGEVQQQNLLGSAVLMALIIKNFALQVAVLSRACASSATDGGKVNSEPPLPQEELVGNLTKMLCRIAADVMLYSAERMGEADYVEAEKHTQAMLRKLVQ